jgi:carbamoyltransferase
MSTKILGINCLGSYDVSASLIVDGQVVAAVEEERLNRIHKTGEFPIKSINFCLNAENISINDLDSIAISGDPALYKSEFFLPLAIQYPNSNTFLRNLEMAAKHHNIEKTIREETKYKGPIRFHLHHFTHWASVYYTSNVEESAIISVDGVGESQCVLTGIAKEKEFEIISEVKWPNSLGVLYNGISHWCGFNYKDAGKVMGLAPYGKKSEFADIFKKLIILKKDGTYEFNPDFITFGYERDTWFKGEFLEVIGKPRKPGTELSQKEKDLSFSMQNAFEETMLHMLNHLYDQTKSDNICVVGGCAYNCATNGLILKNTNFKHVFVQPAAGDGGTSTGAALYDYHTSFSNSKRSIQKNTYLGPEFSTKEIESSIKESEFDFEKIENPSKKGAELLKQGNIISWFQGKMEFGPRALGNRSIIAPPFPIEMKDKVNHDVKHRESFRPFAPAVLEEKYSEYFENCANTQYMLVNTYVHSNKIKEIPAVTHVDNTARVQSVSLEKNALFYNLIKEFGEMSGIYVVLNTSFNDRNMPIVCSPNDAIQCLRQTGLEHLIIGNFWVKK